MYDEEYSIEKRLVATPVGTLVVAAATDTEGDLSFPIPEIQDMPCVIAGHAAVARFRAEPREHAQSNLHARRFSVEDSVSFYVGRQRVGTGFVEDGEIDFVSIESLAGLDEAGARRDIEAFCRATLLEGGDELKDQINGAVAAVEKDCLVHRAAALRRDAQDTLREADIMEAEAESLTSGPTFG